MWTSKHIPGELYRMIRWVPEEQAWYAYDKSYLLARVCEDYKNFGEFLTSDGLVERLPLVYFITENEFRVYENENKIIQSVVND